jgi:hypothetical protein
MLRWECQLRFLRPCAKASNAPEQADDPIGRMLDIGAAALSPVSDTSIAGNSRL